jgi:hypothetical protein
MKDILHFRRKGLHLRILVNLLCEFFRSHNGLPNLRDDDLYKIKERFSAFFE